MHNVRTLKRDLIARGAIRVARSVKQTHSFSSNRPPVATASCTCRRCRRTSTSALVSAHVDVVCACDRKADLGRSIDAFNNLCSLTVDAFLCMRTVTTIIALFAHSHAANRPSKQ